MERVSPAVSGVRVRAVAGGVGKLELTTSGSATAAVLGSGDRPILRVGPRGVQANVSSPEWFAFNEPLGIAPVPARRTRTRWVRVSAVRSWEWFDHRLHPSGARVDRWSIPLLVDGVRVTVSGRVEQMGGALAVHPSRTGLPAGVHVSGLDRPVAALRLRNDGAAAVSVLGRDGELFASVGPGGTRVNVRSPLWVPTAQYRNRDLLHAVIDPGARPQLVLVSQDPELIWPDPRLVSQGSPRSSSSTWAVALRTAGGRRLSIAGSTVVVARPAEGTSEPPPRGEIGAERLVAGPADGGGGGLAIALWLAAASALLSGAALVVRRRR